MEILLAWLGDADIRSPESADSDELGPILNALQSRQFDTAHLLLDHSQQKTQAYVEWLALRSQVPVRAHSVSRVQLLRAITGTQWCRQLSQKVTRTTYVLLNAANGYGNYGQHVRDTSPDACFAYAGLNVCIELASSLAGVLQPKVTE